MWQHTISRSVRLKSQKERDSSSADLFTSERSTIMSQSELLVRKNTKRVTLNVGGVKDEVLWSTLDRLPSSRLGKLRNCTRHEELLELCDDYNESTNEFYFDRHPSSFRAILHFYRSGKLHLPKDALCITTFAEDLRYWDVDDKYLETCCRNKCDQLKEQADDKTLTSRLKNEDTFGEGKFAKIRKCLWNLFENPGSLTYAKVVSIISTVFVLLAVITVMLNTVPEFAEYECIHEDETICTSSHPAEESEPHSSISEDWIPVENHILSLMEKICIAWFTLEYLLRLVAAPNKFNFLRALLNIIDLVAILPFYTGVMFRLIYNLNHNPFFELGRMLLPLKIVRIFKIFEMTPQNSALQAVSQTLRKSVPELVVILVCFACSAIVFATFAYFMEREENPAFESIPVVLWWSIVTMTTVGYGDMSPVTIKGKIVGSVCCVFGVLLVVAMPVAMVVKNFKVANTAQKMFRK